MIAKKEKRITRHRRVRAKVFGTEERPRLCVFRSNQHIYAQLIDDKSAATLLSVGDTDLKLKGKKVDTSKQVGLALAEKALSKNIKEVIFDRGGYQYHGRVKSLAEGAREGGLKF